MEEAAVEEAEEAAEEAVEVVVNTTRTNMEVGAVVAKVVAVEKNIGRRMVEARTLTFSVVFKDLMESRTVHIMIWIRHKIVDG